ncbi:ribonuclease HII [Thalassobellus suaedae]|uniref:Ribonuclease HII n=1 Tax=Thalassobellus suaedae TaxID=3074124 RepID=A0ABY9XU78_9FLAO|nr:ribonuclease HII [Flavobacteriaceae bacterium HL-DH14]
MRFFYTTLFLFIVFSCSNTSTKKSKLIDFVPEKTSLIIKTSNLESLKNSLHNSDFLQKLSKTTSYENLEKKLEGLSLLKPKSDLLICFSEDNNDSLQYTIITKHHNLLFKIDSLKNYTEESLIYKNKTITKSTLNNNTFYSTLIDSTFFASSSKTIIDDVFNNKNTDSDLEKIYTTTSNDKTTSIIIKPNNPFIKSFFINDSLNINSFTNYIAVDIDINQDDILINGITKASDSTETLINIFKGTIPQENLIQNITPSNSDGFMSFTFDDYKTFKTNLSKFTQKDSITNTMSLFDNIIEVGVIYEDKNKAVILNSLDVIATKDALLSEQNNIETYRQIDIYSFSKPDVFANSFSPLIPFKNANKYCVLDHFFVFAESTEMLQNIIANYQNKTTLNERSYFKDIKEQLTDASSLIIVVNPSNLKDVLEKNGLNAIGKLDKYNASALQFIYDTNFAHVNGILKKSKIKAILNSVSEELNIKLEHEILNTPQFVTNHITKQKEIVVQDITNNLYLISNTGKILWKKQLQGPVLGTINQIDIYKNGRLQLAFATPNRVYVLDRNGNDVSPFPAKFNDNITQPLSVFDYDKNKNYRLLVTQGKHTLMYDVNAKLVKGFTFKSANNTIICQPKHFRIGSKDFISFKTQNKLYILNRTGKARVTPKTSNTYSKEPIFLYQNKFTTTTDKGDLITIDTKGNTAIQNLNLSENHSIETTSKTLVTLSENKLTIKNKSVELDYGNYSKPRIFYLNDKIYVTVTDLQTQKTYLYDSQAKLLSNFPVYGNSIIDMDNVDKDKNLEFITKGDANSILLYQIN